MRQRKNTPLKALSLTVATAVFATSAGLAFTTPAAAEEVAVTPISDIQGTGSTSAKIGEKLTTRGVVTASYPTGGIKGFVIQTEGTGPTKKSEGASDAIFVYTNNDAVPAIGAFVEVTGTVGEYKAKSTDTQSLTQLSAPTVVELSGASFTAPLPYPLDYPSSDEGREAYESMLVAPVGTYTVTDTYSTNQYGEVVLAFGDTELFQPTDRARPGTPEAAAVAADNAARKVVLDDGATTNFTSNANRSQTPPYVSLENPVRVGATVTFDEPLILDVRNNAWKFNPTSQALPGEEPASFKNTRTSSPDKENIGAADLTVASFNVLNYFTTTGDTWPDCTFYADRAGNPTNVNSCGESGPRGAWDADNLKRQQDKIVAAINATDASVVGLMEIENSAALKEEADEATETLVAALNAAAGTEKWAFVPSSADLPVIDQQDVITNAIIYQKNEVTPLGDSYALGTQSGAGQPFSNAREPLGQAFQPVGDDATPLFVSVNHFKSKGSAGPLAGDEDSGDGQSASNASRVAQATAVVEWIPTVLADIKEDTGETVHDVALLGDFNSYTEEDPMHVFYDAGFLNSVKEAGTGEFSYTFGSMAGSLDHVLYNKSMIQRVTGADIWEINSPESIALEYSRYNGQGTLFYAPDAYRSSDHDPVILGLKSRGLETTTLNILDINDFHGRIDANTVKFAGTVEESRKAFGEDKTLFLSAGDNIGASLFASAVAKDTPTLEILNALDLATSVVGNHEFDQGLVDLEGRVNDEADFNYLGANVYVKGTKRPVLKEFEVFDVDGIKVGVIGAVTEETPTLVSPAGVADIDFGDPVEAVNRVAAKLTDGRAKNGEADVLIALYHEGAGAGTPDNSSLEQELAGGGVFADIVTKTDEKVAAIFTGHTHKEYAWLGDNGDLADRPVIQTGNYGERIGQALITVNVDTKEVVSAQAKNIARTTDSDTDLIAKFPRVAEVNTIVGKALADAAIVGEQKIGSITADVTRAFAGGSFTEGVYTGGTKDDRSEASAMGNLVADSLLATLGSQDRGGADIGVVNPGGMREELRKGDITYAQANAVLPFVNNLWTTNLTGAQVKTMLEQQWQLDDKGNVPSRPYLQLGLSKNVTYTYDSARDQGDRITSITVNGSPIDPAATYTIGTFSFLATGGDNFRVFKDSTGTKDSGLIDRDAWISYLTANPDLAPNFARSGVEVSTFPSSIKAGETLALDVKRINTFSLGAPENTEVSLKWTGGKLTSPVDGGTVPVTNGEAKISVAVPAAAAGAGALVIVANGTSATVTLPITVAAADVVIPVKVAAKVTSSFSKSTISWPSKGVVKVTVTASGVTPTGKVYIYDNGKKLATGTLKKSSTGKATATITLPKLSPDKYKFEVRYAGDTKVKSAKATTSTLTVKKQATAPKVTVSNNGKTIGVTVSAKVTPAGKVTLKVGSKSYVKTLKGGKATFKISQPKKGKTTYKASYSGSKNSASSTKTVVFTVR